MKKLLIALFLMDMTSAFAQTDPQYATLVPSTTTCANRAGFIVPESVSAVATSDTSMKFQVTVRRYLNTPATARYEVLYSSSGNTHVVFSGTILNISSGVYQFDIPVSALSPVPRAWLVSNAPKYPVNFFAIYEDGCPLNKKQNYFSEH